ncbi:Bacterial type II secretion system protein F domain protein [Vibrio aerogenes CECT 7868]|uniref:Bacterial type II secretion system protein F domain protein n=1 Tax=Vibrio aerogenes CECT 7868 TaxID=1216006 RepID=A0A1M5ZSI2_9VIBR|nr:type II secretion system F family protein [Vibrio aerogenes]SHI27275.1 Bacterial type II secretion system protein F domain protein [Vibrio aerogenes CECT 7868]
MNRSPLIDLGAGCLLFALGLILLGLYFRNRRTGLACRLNTRDDKVNSEEDILLRHQTESVFNRFPVLVALAAFGDKLAGTQSDRRKTQRLLAMAGFHDRRYTGLFTLSKYACGLICITGYFMLGTEPGQRLSMMSLAAGLMLLFLSSLTVELWVKVRASGRGKRLSDQLPDALDLMVICAGAGLPLARILDVVSTELAFSAPEVAQELGYTFTEMQILSDRRRALMNLSDRCAVDNVSAMVSTLIQAERYGTPLSQALKTISEESRKALVLGLEEKTGKLPAQLSVPLMTLILPPVIAMMGAPAMVRIIRMLAD